MTRVLLRRGPLVESRHLVHVAVTNADGRLVASAGDPDLVSYMRSAAKPFQALALVREGVVQRFGMTPVELAVCCGSHGGEAIHVNAVRRILRRAGVGEDSLACGSHLPQTEAAAAKLLGSGRSPEPIHNNCSGKHAGMLALARARAWPTDGYHEVDHPVQVRMRREVGEWAGTDPDGITIGVDGCGVACFGLPLRAMARAYAALARAADAGDDAAYRVVGAMAAHPRMVAGTDRLCTRVLSATGGRVIAKVGAEGIYCAADRTGGFGLAIKVEDGARRACEVALLRVLDLLGAIRGTVREEFRGDLGPEVLNTRGEVVGHLEGQFELHPESAANQEHPCSSTA